MPVPIVWAPPWLLVVLPREGRRGRRGPPAISAPCLGQDGLAADGALGLGLALLVQPLADAPAAEGCTEERKNKKSAWSLRYFLFAMYAATFPSQWPQVR